MARPIEELDEETARNAVRLIATQVAQSEEDVSWDWRLLPARSNAPLAVSAFRSTTSEPTTNMEKAIDLTLRKIGLQLRGTPYRRSAANAPVTLSYYVGPL